MLVSICIAVHNSSKYIVETLTSIQNQTYTNFECVIVDDYSTDDTVSIIYDKFCKNDKRFKLFVNCTDPLKPYIDSHNLSYKFAKGKYLFRVDHDDVLMPDCVEFQVKFMEAHEDIDAACVNMMRVGENPNGTINKDVDVTDTLQDPREREYKQYASTKEACDLFNKYNAYAFKLNLMTWFNQASCIRRSFFEAVQPRYEIFRTGDYVFWWRVLAGGAKLYKHHEVKMYYRETDVSLCRQPHFRQKTGIDYDYQILLARYKSAAFRHKIGEVYPDGTEAYAAYRIFDNTVNYFVNLKEQENV